MCVRGTQATAADAPADATSIFKIKQAALEERIRLRHEAALQEAEALEELKRQLEEAAGPEKESVEGLRKLLEQASMDISVASKEYREAAAEVAEAKKQTKALAETKAALSDRLLEILAANENAKARRSARTQAAA